MLTAGAVLWSVFTLATPSMAGDLPALLATRAVMGMGEGVAMPAISNLFAKCPNLRCLFLAPAPLAAVTAAQLEFGMSRALQRRMPSVLSAQFPVVVPFFWLVAE